MILKSCNSKNYTFYYVQKSFRTETGKCSTKNIERLGTIYDLRKRFGDKDPIGEAKKYVAELTAAEKESNKKVIVEYSPTVFIQKNEQRSYNGGYLFLQNIYYELGLDYICKKIEKKHKNKYTISAKSFRTFFTLVCCIPAPSCRHRKTPGSSLNSRKRISIRSIELSVCWRQSSMRYRRMCTSAASNLGSATQVLFIMT